MAGLWIKLVEQGVNQTNNTSTVAAYVYLTGNGQSYNYDPCPGTLTLDGTTYSFSHSFTTSTSDQLLYSVSKTVSHNSDGTKTVNASATFSTDTSAFGNLSASKSLVLTKITTTTDLGYNRIKLDQYDYEYDGTAKTPTVTISGLTEGVDFTVAYSNNINIGMGIVTITGKGSYTGTKYASFNIYPKRKIKIFSRDKEVKGLYYGSKRIIKIWVGTGTDLIRFTIEGVAYQAEEGMTWQEWVDSTYNTDGYDADSYYVTYTVYEGSYYDTYIIEDVLPTDIISNGATYVYSNIGYSDDELY